MSSLSSSFLRSCEGVSYMALWTEGHCERMCRPFWWHERGGTQTAEIEGTPHPTCNWAVWKMSSNLSDLIEKKNAM